MLPSFGLGLTKQKSFGTSVLTSVAAAEEDDAKQRCVAKISLMAKRVRFQDVAREDGEATMVG